MKNRMEKTYGNLIVFETNDYKWGVKDICGNEIVPVGKYGWIDGFDHGLARVRTHGNTGYTKNIIAVFTDDLSKVITDPTEIEALEAANKNVHPEQYSKWGIINEKGEEVLPLEYDSVWKFIGKNREYTNVVKEGWTHKIFFQDLNSEIAAPLVNNRYEEDDSETHYGEYAGSYAQDVIGYSDDVIDDAFEGNPDMYWNID